MKILLDVKDEKAQFLIELLKNFSFVKAKQITPETALFLTELKESIEEVNLAKAGKIKLKSALDLVDEL
jgi:hypothetical protein